MDRVHLEIAFGAGDVIDTDAAAVTDSYVLVDDCLSDDGALTDTDVGDTLACVLGSLFLCLIVACTHAVYAVEGCTGFNDGSDTDD